MADRSTWQQVEQDILSALDIASEYKQMGVHFSKDRPSESGWQSCHAAGREDKHPSAAVYVGTGRLRGRYRDMAGGDGISLSLWEFAARYSSFTDWKAARKHFSDKTGIKLPSGGEPKKPHEQLFFYKAEACVSPLTIWASLKGGFDYAAIECVGGHYCRWPKNKKSEHSHGVAAFAAYNPPELLDCEPSAWVIASIEAKDLPLYRGKGSPPQMCKTLSVTGSTGGLLGRSALEILGHVGATSKPEVVWKVEGLSDLLAITHQIQQAGLWGKHVAISNSQGCMETVKPSWIELLRGHTVHVVGDQDEPGQQGALRWCQALSGTARSVKNVMLPFELQKSHGQDLRDFFRGTA